MLSPLYVRKAPKWFALEPPNRPYPATWLNGERWEDDYQPERPAQSSNVGYRDMEAWKGKAS